MLKIKKGDTVRVTAGKDKGKEGVVEKVSKSSSNVVYMIFLNLCLLEILLWFAHIVKR